MVTQLPTTFALLEKLIANPFSSSLRMHNNFAVFHVAIDGSETPSYALFAFFPRIPHFITFTVTTTNTVRPVDLEAIGLLEFIPTKVPFEVTIWPAIPSDLFICICIGGGHTFLCRFKVSA